MRIFISILALMIAGIACVNATPEATSTPAATVTPAATATADPAIAATATAQRIVFEQKQGWKLTRDIVYYYFGEQWCNGSNGILVGEEKGLPEPGVDPDPVEGAPSPVHAQAVSDSRLKSKTDLHDSKHIGMWLEVFFTPEDAQAKAAALIAQGGIPEGYVVTNQIVLLRLASQYPKKQASEITKAFAWFKVPALLIDEWNKKEWAGIKGPDPMPKPWSGCSLVGQD